MIHRRMKIAVGVFFFFWMASPLIPPALAERYAVLMGITNYKDHTHVPRLVGPTNDVHALKALLASRYGFLESNITVLVNAEASKRNILHALSQLRTSTKAGDFIFIYFSGHGTSGRDPYVPLPLGDFTGAIVPCEFSIHGNTTQGMLSELIVGKRDLKPIFTDLDQGRELMVVFDACFSGNSVRSVMDCGIPKRVSCGLPPWEASFRSMSKEPYPYKNIIYMSASDEMESARDLLVSAYDGKPHGALTDCLLQGLEGKADTNHDGVISYEELYQYAKRGTQRYGQTPQILYRSALDRPVFQKTVPATGTVREEGNGRLLRVKIQGKHGESLAAKVGSLAGVKVVEGNYDLLLAGERNAYSLYLSGGEKLGAVEREDEAALRVARYAKARELINLENMKQRFNVWIKAGTEEGRSVFFEGETLKFSVKSEESAYLLLLDIDPEGNVTVLLPDCAASEAHVGKEEVLQTRELGKVKAPFGVEFLKLFAFKQKVRGLEKFGAKTCAISPTEKEFAELMDLIRQQSDWAEDAQQVVTVKKQ